MKKTFLYEAHVELGAKLAEFGGFLMPIQYQGIVAEHQAVRTAAGFFDTCHMGEFQLRGPQAAADLERLLSCPVHSLEPGRCRYGMLCNENGGVIDDQLLYRLAEDEFMMVVNAGTQDADFAWVQGHCSPETAVLNLSESTAKLDIQGPASPKLVQELIGASLAGMRFYAFSRYDFNGEEIIVSRTGYTGEVGFEIYCSPELVPVFWQRALELGVVPVGLGARDTLRLEMAMPLYGHELDSERNALSAGFSRAIDLSKDFIGADALRTLAEKGLPERLVCLQLQERRAARAGDMIVNAQGTAVGQVTSGSFAPSIGVAIAMGYVRVELAEPGTELQLQAARSALPAKVIQAPFYTQATGRKPLKDFLD